MFYQRVNLSWRKVECWSIKVRSNKLSLSEVKVTSKLSVTSLRREFFSSWVEIFPRTEQGVHSVNFKTTNSPPSWRRSLRAFEKKIYRIKLMLVCRAELWDLGALSSSSGWTKINCCFRVFRFRFLYFCFFFTRFWRISSQRKACSYSSQHQTGRTS